MTLSRLGTCCHRIQARQTFEEHLYVLAECSPAELAQRRMWRLLSDRRDEAPVDSCPWTQARVRHMQEIDFVMSDLSLEIIGDFAIVWLLSPKKSFSAAPSGGVSQFASRLPGHSLQVTTFCPLALCHRLVCISGVFIWTAPLCIRLC